MCEYKPAIGVKVMDLRTLLDSLIPYQIQGSHRLEEINISSIEMDSRKVSDGSLFVCTVGTTFDGHKFAEEVMEQGAAAIIAQKPLNNVDIPVIIVPDTRRALAFLADRFYEYPTHRLRLIGVTGTNGKTTMTHLIEKIFEDKGKKTGRIGTMNIKIGDELLGTKHTTPESPELQQAFSKMIDVGSDYAVIEVSSHAIHQGRVRGCNFKTIVFTNLTQDHLDYHGTMEEYKRAKGLIFSQLGNKYDKDDLKYAILNADDEAHYYYKQITAAQVLTYGINHQDVDIWAKNIKLTGQGTSFTVECFSGTEDFNLHMLGKFNIYNVLGAIGAGLVEGITLSEMKDSIEAIKGVRGRVEPVDGGQDFTVIIDYAHTPDSLENVLTTIKEFAKGDIYCIVGCGGDRDRSKRPIMANIAATFADLTVLTSDNPRSEDPKNIIQDMEVGLLQNNIPKSSYVSIPDRREAIYWTIQQAKVNDVVLIAGKGHETYQQIKGEVIDFDDRSIALEALAKRV
jgi:UDP-N-acetylmuramoyl-L-alanyl-D-glutamate--2,6-diaminopimelate ligase